MKPTADDLKRWINVTTVVFGNMDAEARKCFFDAALAGLSLRDLPASNVPVRAEPCPHCHGLGHVLVAEVPAEPAL